jgi:hypothetical protein
MLDLSLGRFYGIDSLIEISIAVISFVIFGYSRRIYKIVRERNYQLFSWAFLLIGISFILKIISNFTLLHKIQFVGANFVYTIIHEFEYMDAINFIGYIGFKLLFALGFILLFLIITKTKQKEDIFLIFYLSIITLLFSIYFDFVFHLTIMFISLILTFHFYENHKTQREKSSLLVFLSFGLIFLSSLIFIFNEIHSAFYVLGEILLLAGFVIILINHIRSKNNEEKNKYGDSERHIRSVKRVQKGKNNTHNLQI